SACIASFGGSSCFDRSSGALVRTAPGFQAGSFLRRLLHAGQFRVALQTPRRLHRPKVSVPFLERPARVSHPAAKLAPIIAYPVIPILPPPFLAREIRVQFVFHRSRLLFHSLPNTPPGRDRRSLFLTRSMMRMATSSGSRSTRSAISQMGAPSFHIRSTTGISVRSHQTKLISSNAIYTCKRLFISVHPAGLKAVAITDHPPVSLQIAGASGSVPQ